MEMATTEIQVSFTINCCFTVIAHWPDSSQYPGQR